jgi:hypothetical protein
MIETPASSRSGGREWRTRTDQILAENERKDGEHEETDPDEMPGLHRGRYVLALTLVSLRDVGESILSCAPR